MRLISAQNFKTHVNTFFSRLLIPTCSALVEDFLSNILCIYSELAYILRNILTRLNISGLIR